MYLAKKNSLPQLRDIFPDVNTRDLKNMLMPTLDVHIRDISDLLNKHLNRNSEHSRSANRNRNRKKCCETFVQVLTFSERNTQAVYEIKSHVNQQSESHKP